jgi:hypothetical protein
METGRWPNTLREECICHLCNVGLGTEFHFLFECTSADVQRLRCKFMPVITNQSINHIFYIEITYFHPDFAPCKQGFIYV